MAAPACDESERRALARAAGLNGLDYVSVGRDGRTLTVYFLLSAPRDLTRPKSGWSVPTAPRPVRSRSCRAPSRTPTWTAAWW